VATTGPLPLTLMRLTPRTSHGVTYRPFSEADNFTGDWEAPE